MDESGLPGFQAVSWHGIMAPAGTSEDIIAKLAKVTREALASPEVKERLAQEGAEASGLSQAEFGKFVASELASWGKAVKLSGASAD
jgi:tripartite-type tricarboxylate transporter receptor subunit TctC